MRLQPRLSVFALGAVVNSLSIVALDLPASAEPIFPGSPPKDYQVEYLASDGAIPTEHLDSELKNGWGLAASAEGPWWIALNEANASQVFGPNGAPQALHVGIPGPPTGIVHSDGDGFVVTDGSKSGPARFLFATENGKIAGWNPEVGPSSPEGEAFVGVDRSASGAIYKGLALARTVAGDRLYATDFHNGKVDVFDDKFAPIATFGRFRNPRIPDGFAPFGIQVLAGRIFVSYAKQDSSASDELHGRGLGMVAVYDIEGLLIAEVAEHGSLNAPWGLAMAPPGFGEFSGRLLVGNFGDGMIAAYTMTDDMMRFTPAGVLRDSEHRPIAIDGLWGIAFGNNASAGPATDLFFAAGPSDETHGSFGRIRALPAP